MVVKFGRAVMLLAAGLTIAGCQYVPHELELKPQVYVSEATVGTNTRVHLRLVDERDDATVGHRAVATIGAKISAKNLPTVVESELRNGLAKKGYQLVPSAEGADAVATFRLRAFKYYIEQGLWSGGQNTSAVLAVDARRSNQDYTNVYRFSNEDRIVTVQDGGALDHAMNAALTSILKKALTDTELDLFLTGRGVVSGGGMPAGPLTN